MTTEISQKKLAIINYFEYLSLQLLAHQNNKINKDESIYCDTIEEAIEAINDMLPDDIAEKLYEIYQTQVVELNGEELNDCDESWLGECKAHHQEKVDAL